MPRSTRFATLTLLWFIQLNVTTLRAQEPAAAPVAASEPAPARTWQPKRFPPMYPQPRAAAPQARDAERPQEEEDLSEPLPRHTGLLIGGVVTFINSYLVTVLASAVVNGINDSDCKANAFADKCNDGKLMLVPLVGPFLTEESLAVQLMLAGPQILGALLIVIGAVRASRPLRRSERASLDLRPVPLPAGGMLTATLEL